MLTAPTAPVPSTLIGLGHAADQPVRVRVLAAEDRLDLDDLLLEVERLEVVRRRQQIRLGRQLVRRVAPVGVGEDAELAALDELLQAALHVAEVARRRVRPRRDALLDLGGLLRVGLERRHDVHPVERVQVVEVDEVVLRVQRRVHQVADDVRVLRDLDPERVLDRAHRCQRVHAGAHAADALDERPRVARVAALEDDLEAAPHRAGGHRVADHVVLVDVDLDAQVALDARDRVDDDALAAVVEREALGLDGRHVHFSTSLTLSLRPLLRACLIALTAACAAMAAPATPRAVRPIRSAVPSTPGMPGARIVVRWS